MFSIIDFFKSLAAATPDKPFDSLIILEKVDAFYSKSFTSLITITIAILAFMGVLLPLIIQWLQKRFFRIENELIKKTLRAEIKSEVEKKLEEKFSVLSKEVRTEYEEKMETLEEKIKALEEKTSNSTENLGKSFQLKIYRLEAGLYFNLAHRHLDNKKFVSASLNFAISTKHSLYAKEYTNALRSLNSLISKTLPAIHTLNSDLFKELEEEITTLIALFKKEDHSDHYTDLLRDLNKAITDVKTRSEQAVENG